MNEKIVIIINGRGGSGKDTICDVVAKYFAVNHISSITPIKTLATSCGWNGTKDPKGRKFLSDLKTLCVEYNDLCLKYILAEYSDFLISKYDILFIDIREAEEIEKAIKAINDSRCITLLIKRDSIKDLGNKSDDDVENYTYEYTYDNNGTLDNLEYDFIRWFTKNIK